MNRSALKFIILYFSFVLFLAACGRRPPPPGPPPPPVDDLALPALSGPIPEVIRTADMAGQVQLLIFLRTDDEPCRATVPVWNALVDDYGSRGFALVGIAVDSRPVPLLANEAAELGAAFPIGLADDAVLAAFGGLPALRAIPTAFLIDRDGHLAQSYPGFVPWDQLRLDIDAALDRLPLPSLATEEDEAADPDDAE